MEAWTAKLVDDMLAALRSIDSSLKLLVKQQIPEQPKTVATPAQLDTQYGDPVLKKMPKFWSGEDYSGQHYSQLPPELLDMVAEALEWMARKADEKDEKTAGGKPISTFKRYDAARARGWAKRKRDGWVAPQQPSLASDARWANAPAEKLGAWASPVGGDDISF